MIRGINERIQKQEEKDFYIASRVIKEGIGSSGDIELEKAPQGYSVDIFGVTSYKNFFNTPSVKFNIEIKERWKGEKCLKQYPHAELKKDKLERMRIVTPRDTRLYYITLLNGKIAYVYDMDNLDWSRVNMVEWEMKKTEYSNDETKIKYWTYQIPYTMATYTIDCSKYYEDWNNGMGQ